MVHVYNMCKWGRSVAIESYKNKIAKLENKIKNSKQKTDEQK